MIAIVEKDFSGVGSIIDHYPQVTSYGSEFLGPLAYVYRLAGRDGEFDLLMAEMDRVLSFQEKTGTDNWYHWYCRAQHSVLANDGAAATTYLQRAVDSGLASVIFVEPLFDLMADDAAFQAVAAQMIARANLERDKLGLPAFQTFANSN
jgi:hypothetical protein